MATMIPAVYGRRTPYSERKIFERLQKDPDCRGWTVFHSLGLGSTRIGPHGEIDFVVLIPDEGVVCLEVKGGEVSCRNGIWKTKNTKTGKVDTLDKSPYLQARENMFALRDDVTEEFGFGHSLTETPFSYAVVFPAVPRPPHTPEFEDAETIDIEDLRTPISSLLTANARKNRKKLPRAVASDCMSANTLNILKKYLRPDFERLITRSATIIESEEQLIQLTEEQYHFLDVAEANQRALIRGAAGTGKTVLAMEYARREAARGRKVLLLCYNTMLAEWIEDELSSYEEIRAGTFHSVAQSVISSSPLSTDFYEEAKGVSKSEKFNTLIPTYAETALSDMAALCDTLIIDEAQDLLSDGNLAALNGMVSGGLDGGRFAVFGDFHRQAIYMPSLETDEQADDPDEADEMSAESLLRRYSPSITLVPLSVNCRNTRQIGEETALMSGFSALPYQLGKVSGLSVDYRYYKRSRDELPKLESALQKLYDEGVKESDIVILGLRQFDSSAASGVDLSGAPWRVVDGRNDDPGDNLIPYFTVHAFKGLESSVVILTGISDITTLKNRSLLYVGMSRAKSHLCVILDKKVDQDVQQRVALKLSDGWDA